MPILKGIPLTIKVGDGKKAHTYQLDKSCVARPLAGAPAGGRPYDELRDGETSFVIEPQGATVAASEGQMDILKELKPVYRLPGGGRAVATGRMFVRLRDGAVARAKFVAGLDKLGLKVLREWPSALLVGPPDGNATHSLKQLKRLRASATVASAEPQLLSRRSLR